MGCECENGQPVPLSVASWLRPTYSPTVVISSLIDKAGRGWEMQSHLKQGRSERMDGEERILGASGFPLLTKQNKTKRKNPTFLNVVATN